MFVLVIGAESSRRVVERTEFAGIPYTHKAIIYIANTYKIQVTSSLFGRCIVFPIQRSQGPPKERDYSDLCAVKATSIHYSV